MTTDGDAIATTRTERLRALMAEEGLDVVLCMKPEHAFYLSGFNPIIFSHPLVAILPRAGEPVLLMHALRDDHAHAEAFVREIRLYGAWGIKKTMGPDWRSALAEIVSEFGLSGAVIGVEEDDLALGRYRSLRESFPEATFRNASPLLRQARLVKDPLELDNMRIAADIADRGMDAAIAAVAERASERETSVRAMEAMNRHWLDAYPEVEVADFGSLEGGVQNGLWCWTLVGDRVAINCDNPTMRRPSEGELVVVFIWTVCNGCHAENERTVAVGELDDEKRAAFEALLEIREGGMEALRPGKTVADLYGACRAGYERLGYGPYLPGRIGHGLGLGAHEGPSLGPDNRLPLEPGMVLTFEPNLRIPSFGGLQHSDTVAITTGGFEFLTQTRRDFIRV